MERRSRLVHPHACLPPLVLVTGATRSKTAGRQVTLEARCIHSIPHDQHSAERSLRVKYRIYRLEQSCVAEWLEQALDRTVFE